MRIQRFPFEPSPLKREGICSEFTHLSHKTVSIVPENFVQPVLICHIMDDIFCP